MKLRNYKIYMQKLKSFAKLCNVKISFVSYLHESEGGQYKPNHRQILIDSSMEESEIIATFLHELGHFIDDLRNPVNNFTNRFLNEARSAVEKDKPLTYLQKEKIILAEKAAWKNGRALARQLQIPLGLWFKNEEKNALKSYYALKIRPFNQA